jgi:hypothetical protein
MRRPALEGAAGQASIELVALLPLIVTVAFGVAQVLAAGAAGEAAGGAAEAGAVALLQDAKPRAAALAALPAWARQHDRAVVTVRGRRISVSVRPRGPVGALTRRLTATASASAGPEAGS